ncbi:MAG: hypothetical protein HC927_03755 [Deltaproteobacteria bacterium]|nr:hypothetical protein [Deltaproteobacteria bacterium]
MLFNFLHIERLDLLGPVNGILSFLCDEVLGEVKRPHQRIQVEQALEEGLFLRTVLTSAQELTTFADLNRRFGVGESAVLPWLSTERSSPPVTIGGFAIIWCVTSLFRPSGLQLLAGFCSVQFVVG